MAARINTKIVIPLIVVLAVLAGGMIGLAWYTVRRSPEYYKGKGDVAAAAEDWRTAEEFYSKAVYQDQGNIDLLETWRAAILKIIPVDRIEAKAYYQTASSILKKKTESRPFEPQYHIDWLNHVLAVSMPEVVAGDAAYLAEQTELMLKGKPSSDDNPLWEEAYRFRGIANTHRMQESGFDPQLRDQALSDLENWLAAHPDDATAADAAIKWRLFNAQTLTNRSKHRDALEQIDQAEAAASDFIQTHPDDVLVRTTLAQVLHSRQSIEQALGSAHRDATERRREVILEAETLTLKNKDLPWWLEGRLARVVTSLEGDRIKAAQRALAVIEHALESHPDHPLLKFERASYLARSGRRDEAVTAYQQIIDSPNLPVSRESLQLFDARPSAALALFDMDIDSWRRTDPADAQATAQARDKVQSRMDYYRSMVSSSDAHLLYMEGRFALLDRKPEVAANRLNQFLAAAGGAIQERVTALIDLAAALQSSNRPGAAYEFLAQADVLTGGANEPILRAMIEADIGSQNFDRAQRNLDRLIAADPDSDATMRLRNALALARDGTKAEVADGSLAAILEARKLQMAGEIEQSRALLLKTREAEPNNLLALYELARLEHSEGNTAKALEYVESALSVEPKSEQWRILQAMLSGADLRPVISQIVDERPGLGEFDRHVAKWRVYAQNGFPDEAKQEFHAAKAIDPDAPAILEQDFAMAMAADDLPAAQSIVRRAQQTNADLANGLTFRGRYELETGDPAAAVASLLQATNLKPYDGAAWRFLGIAYREAGNYSAAMDAFSKSIEKEPSNVGTLRELARLHIQRQEYPQALTLIRKAQAFAPADADIQNDYLQFEGRYGDRDKIIQIRKRKLAADPSDLQNALSLVDLYELEHDFDLAKELLDSLDPEEPSDQLLLAQARALWHARQGQLELGRDALVAYTQSSPPPSNELMMRALLGLTQYYVNWGRTEEAVETARSALPYQDPNRREADRALGELHMALGQTDAALETFEQAFVSSEVTPDLSVQIITLHLALAGRDAETDAASASAHRKRAGELLERHEQAHGASVDTLLLRGELKLQNGDADGAERIFNDAVARYPQDSKVYGARAKFNLYRITQAGEIGRANRVRADVDQAMQLSPGDSAPLLTLADLAKARRDPQTGAPSPDTDALIAIWKRILDINPAADAVRGELVATLFEKRELTQARLLLQQAIDRDPSRAAWHEIRGDLERQIGAPAETYANYYGLAFEKQPSANRLGKLARAWLALDPPRGAEVVQLYQKFENEVGTQPAHRLLLARGQAAASDLAAALAGLRAAATMILAEPDVVNRDALMQEWYETLAAIAPTEQMVALSDECFGSVDDPWSQALLGLALHTAATRPGAADRSGLMKAGLEHMTAAHDRIKAMPASEERTRQLQEQVGWNLASAYYSAGEPAKAVELWRWVLEARPEHLGSLNNLAYTLAKDLNDPAAALEPAKRAFEARPADPTVLDTYGYVLFRNDRLDDAERMLRDCLNREEQSGARMHLGQVLAAKGNVDAARRELARARSLSEQQGDPARVKEIDEILKTL